MKVVFGWWRSVAVIALAWKGGVRREGWEKEGAGRCKEEEKGKG